MANMFRKFTLLIFFLFVLTSCSTAPDGPTDGPAGVESEGQILSGCDGLAGSYETAGPRPLEEAPPGEPFSAWLLAFSADGTVLWKYTPEVFSGTFTCRDTVITAAFPKGPRADFEGVFDSEKLQISSEDIVYYKVTEE